MTGQFSAANESQDHEWSDRIEAYRRQSFVGRRRELSRFQAFLDDPILRLLHVSGPGGMGKSTLLTKLVQGATERGLRTRHLDARTLPLAPSLLQESLAGEADLLVIDEFQALAPLGPWLRTDLFPSFPVDRRVVLAQRKRLDSEWRTDPGFRALTASIELDVLSREDCEDYLARARIDRHRWEEILGFARGFPLALCLAIDSRGDNPTALGDELAGAVVRCLLRDVPSPGERRTVEIAAINRATTVSLLADMLDDGDDPRALFDWLAERPFVRATRDGLAVHDVFRDALVRDLARRDEPRRQLLVDRSIAHHFSHQGSGLPIHHHRAMLSIIDVVEVEAALTAKALGIPQLVPDALRESDRAPVLQAIERTMGRTERLQAQRIMDAEPEGAVIGRGPDGRPEAYLHFIELPSHRHDDAVSAASTRWLDTRPALSSGERGLLCRYYLTLEEGSVHQGFVTRELLPRLFATPGVMVAAVAQSVSEHGRHPEYDNHSLIAEVDSGDTRLTVVGHDLREGTFTEAAKKSTFERLAFIRGRTGGGAQPPGASTPSLSRAAFEAGVKAALKSFHHRERLQASELLGARFLRTERGRDVDALRRVLERACRELGGHGTDALHARVLVETYIVDARKQYAAAQELGMAYSTLRKHLAHATQRLVDSLWDLEHDTVGSAEMGDGGSSPTSDRQS